MSMSLSSKSTPPA